MERMSLLDESIADHAAAVQRLRDELAAGSLQEKAALLNLREETRVPEDVRRAFHAALAVSTATTAIERFREACGIGLLSLDLGKPRPPAVRGTWSTCMTIDKLQRFGFVASAQSPGVAPPRRVTLSRRYGTSADGAEHPFWISTCASHDANEVRDRLGLCLVLKGQHLYRLEVSVEVDPERDLYRPSALDSEAQPAWRRPPPEHNEPWGMTRDLRTDAAAEPELLTKSHREDGLYAAFVGSTTESPSTAYLTARSL